MLVHQFDSRDDDDPHARAWLPGGADVNRIVSASLINRAMHPDEANNIPIYSFDLSGVILSPWRAQLLCSYPFDVGSVKRKPCASSGLDMKHCIPGCTPNDPRVNAVSDWGSTSIWCPAVDHNAMWDQQANQMEAVTFGKDGKDACAYRSQDLATMMMLRDGYSEHRRKKPGKTWDDHKFYSELILDSTAFTRMLPNSIEAFFYQPDPTGGGRCFDTFNLLTHKKMHKCEDYAREAHQAFLKHFGLSSRDVPLLKLDIWNWNLPFSDPLVRPPPSPPPWPMPPPRSLAPTHKAPAVYLTHQKCQALMANKKSHLHRLWGRIGWVARSGILGDACWNAYPQGPDGGAWKFFNDAFNGIHCHRNWYTGNAGDLGIHGPVPNTANPHFTKNAPALLGFDDTINTQCLTTNDQHATGCTRANYNILSLYGQKIPYNLCRNFEVRRQDPSHAPETT